MSERVIPSLWDALRERRTARAERRREARLRAVIRDLKDQVFNLERWSFADRPSEYEDRLDRISEAIRRVETLGGDALDALPWGFDYLAERAMPTTFTRTQGYGNRWETHRVGG